jgi:hypothetical protein
MVFTAIATYLPLLALVYLFIRGATMWETPKPRL